MSTWKSIAPDRASKKPCLNFDAAIARNRFSKEAREMKR